MNKVGTCYCFLSVLAPCDTRGVGIAEGTSCCPGVQKLAGVDASEEEVNELVASTIPIGRVGSKWDIAIAAVFLCSSAARHITGALQTSPLLLSVR